MGSRRRVLRGRFAAAIAVAALLGRSASSFGAEGEAFPDASGPFEGVESLDPEVLVRAVLARNPSVKSARLAWQAAVAREPQQGALDDPVLSYSVAPRSIDTNEVRFGNTVALEQRIPFPGKLSLRADVARAEAEAARRDYEAARRDVALAGISALADYFHLERSLVTNAEHLQLVRTLKSSAEGQYAAGRASQQDPIQAEVEIGRLLREQEQLASQRDVVVAELNGLLHRLPGEALPPPPPDLPSPPGPLAPEEALVGEALADRPELGATLSRIEAARAGVDLARREYFPDLGVGATYDSMWDHPRHRFMVGVSIELPVRLARRAGAVAEAAARRSAVERNYDRALDEIRVDVVQSRRRVVESRRIVDLYENSLLPAARDRLGAARSGFESGRSLFFELIEAARELRDLELAHHEGIAALYRRTAELSRAVGEVPGLPAGGGVQ